MKQNWNCYSGKPGRCIQRGAGDAMRHHSNSVLKERFDFQPEIINGIQILSTWIHSAIRATIKTPCTMVLNLSAIRTTDFSLRHGGGWRSAQHSSKLYSTCTAQLGNSSFPFLTLTMFASCLRYVCLMFTLCLSQSHLFGPGYDTVANANYTLPAQFNNSSFHFSPWALLTMWPLTMFASCLPEYDTVANYILPDLYSTCMQCTVGSS